MSDKQLFRLVHKQARENACKAIGYAPDGYVVTICQPNKSRDQECYYHDIFGDAAKQCRHLNEQFDAEGWKRLMIDQFARDMLQDPHCSQAIRDDLAGAVKMTPSLDGRSIVAIGLQSRKFKKETASAFIEWLNAFMSEKNANT